MPTADSAASHRAESTQGLPRESQRGLAIPVLAGIGLLAVSVILAVWRIGLQQSELEEKFLTETLGLAQALSLRPEQAFDAVLPGGAPSDDFNRLSCHLHRFASFAGYQGAWTLIARDGHYQLGPGSHSAGGDCTSHATPAVQAPPAEAKQVLASGQAGLSAPYSRAHTRVVSALAAVPAPSVPITSAPAPSESVTSEPAPSAPVTSEQSSTMPASSAPTTTEPMASKLASRPAVLVGLDLPERAWRAAILGAAILPLALGGVLTLIFAIAVVVVYRSGANQIETANSLRYLEPMLAALTGLALTITATAITFQLEQDFKSDLLEWESARTSVDLSRILQSLTRPNDLESLATQIPNAGLEHQPDAVAAVAVQAVAAAIRQSLPHARTQPHRSKLRIAASLLALDGGERARMIERLSSDGEGDPATPPSAPLLLEPASPLSAAAQLQELLPVLVGDQTLALRLRVLSTGAVGPATRAAGATALIGVILTAVATVLVIWLRGRLASLEQLLDQRTAILQRREKNFAAITNAVRDAIIMMDDGSKIAYWNPAAERLFGYTETEARGRDLHSLIGGADVDAAYRNRSTRSAAPGSGPVIGQLLELEGRHRDGSRLPLEVSLSAMRMDDAWHAIGVLRDISARKRSQERLVKLNDCLAHLGSDYRENIARITAVCGEILEAGTALYNKLDNNMLITLGRWQAPEDLPYKDDPEGHICYDLIRGRHDRTSGYCGAATDDSDSRDALFLPDLSQTPYLDTDLSVRKYALKAYFGHVVRCGDSNVGSLCVVFTHQRAPSDEEKRLLGILAAALTTEENRHLATRELELSEKRMSLAMRSTGIGIWEYEPGPRQLRLDASMHGLLALQPTLAVRSIDDWMLRLLPEDMPKLHHALASELDEDDELDEEMRVQIAEDELRYLRIIGSVHRRDRDADRHIIGVCYDITRRKETEARLRHACDMAEQASQLKTRFLSQVSHELRTPMNAVLGFAQLLDSDPDLNSDQHDSVREILQSGRHLLKLIDEVLDLAQIESGETDLQIQEVALPVALEESLALIRQLAKEHQIHIDFASPEGLAVAADPFRLKQILINLLSNAVKYNRPDGRVGLDASALPARAGGEQRVRIRVTDTGAGIPAEQMADLFEPFRRLPDAQLQGIKGAGLGLAVVKSLVAMMGGEIGVESTLGQGSCFWIDLPRRPAAEATAALLKPGT